MVLNQTRQTYKDLWHSEADSVNEELIRIIKRKGGTPRLSAQSGVLSLSPRRRELITSASPGKRWAIETKAANPECRSYDWIEVFCSESG